MRRKTICFGKTRRRFFNSPSRKYFLRRRILFSPWHICQALVDANRSFAVLGMTLGQEYKRGRIFKSFENSCHSLHKRHNSLILSTSPCNDKQKSHVTDVTSQSSDISDMRKTSTLHGRVLILSLLQHPCNECNVYSNLFYFLMTVPHPG